MNIKETNEGHQNDRHKCRGKGKGKSDSFGRQNCHKDAKSVTSEDGETVKHHHAFRFSNDDWQNSLKAQKQQLGQERIAAGIPIKGHNNGNGNEKGKPDNLPPHFVQAMPTMAETVANSVSGTMIQHFSNHRSDASEVSQSQAPFGGRAEQEFFCQNKVVDMNDQDAEI